MKKSKLYSSLGGASLNGKISEECTETPMKSSIDHNSLMVTPTKSSTKSSSDDDTAVSETPTKSSNSIDSEDSLIPNINLGPSKLQNIMNIVKKRKLNDSKAKLISKNNVIVLWLITENKNVVGLAIDGSAGYYATSFLNGSITPQQLSYLTPYSNGLIQAKFPSKLLKQSDPIVLKLLFDDVTITEQDKLTYMQNNAPYMVSKTGQQIGSRNVKFLTSFDTPDGEDFENDVITPIMNFFRKTKYVANKDNKMVIPRDIDHGIQLYSEGTEWEVKNLTFELDTELKTDTFVKLAISDNIY